MTSCVIFGGAGFLGRHLAAHWKGPVRSADLPAVDVRKPIPRDLVESPPDWIFNFAAVHREPGHAPNEYFDTNVAGATNVCDYAEAVGCRNIFFTSSISVYGPTTGPTDESAPLIPATPYGASKKEAEAVHEKWFARAPGRRLIVCRPGVVYGPGDPGNILRMIRAIKAGRFAYPGSPAILKSYAYVFGWLDSVDFWLAAPDARVTYNYVESPTEPLGELTRHVQELLDVKASVYSVPLGCLIPVAWLMRAISFGKSDIHPARVRKAATSTHIVPKLLLDRGFKFQYGFRRSLEHWRSLAPADFA